MPLLLAHTRRYPASHPWEREGLFRKRLLPRVEQDHASNSPITVLVESSLSGYVRDYKPHSPITQIQKLIVTAHQVGLNAETCLPCIQFRRAVRHIPGMFTLHNSSANWRVLDPHQLTVDNVSTAARDSKSLRPA